MATAWAKRSGLGRLATGLRSLRDGDGRSEAVLGIDENGATKEGLSLAMTLFDDVYIFHDPGSRTYHPKIYAVEHESGDVLLIVGSANATRGGLFTNYEASLLVELERGVEEDERLLDETRKYYDSLKGSGAACQRLDGDLLAELVGEPAYGVGSEVGRGRGRRATRRTGRFGSPLVGLAGAPPLEPLGEGEETVEDEDEDDSTLLLDVVETPPDLVAPNDEDQDSSETEQPDASPPEPIAVGAVPTPGTSEAAAPRNGFWKRLSKFDTSAGSAPGQIIIPIRFEPFFDPLVLQIDETATGGVRQSQREFEVTFRDGNWTKTANARVILYEPAASHARPNIELRFTFRDVEIRERLKAGDVLVFTDDGGGTVVDREPAGARSGRFDWL